MQTASLLSLATAVPPNVVEQYEAKATAREAFGGKKALFDRLSGVFDNAGIARRNIVAPLDWYTRSHGWRDRNAVYLESSQNLFIEVASAAIEQAGLAPDEIDGVVTVSTTGIATPSLEARVGPKLGLRDDVRRVPVFGLGCAGGVSGLATASQLAVAEPDGTRAGGGPAIGAGLRLVGRPRPVEHGLAVTLELEAAAPARRGEVERRRAVDLDVAAVLLVRVDPVPEQLAGQVGHHASVPPHLAPRPAA